MLELNAIITCPQCGFAKPNKCRLILESLFINAPVAAQCFVLKREFAVSIVRMQINTAPPSKKKNIAHYDFGEGVSVEFGEE